jgi:imidazolonepropionase-like amidohydrolase
MAMSMDSIVGDTRIASGVRRSPPISRTLLRVGMGLVGLLFVAGVTLAIGYFGTLYTTEAGPPPEIVIRGGTLFAATDTTPIENPGIVLRGGRIGCIGEDCASSDAAIEIDASGLAILPGMIDLHAHLLGRRDDPGLLRTIWDAARMRPDVRRAMLEAGVTALRDVGAPRDAIIEIRNALAARELAGPRLFVAGPIFTAPGGHPAYGGRDPNPSGVGGQMAFQSDDPERVRSEIRRLAAQGVDGVKAVFQGAAGPSGEPLLPTLSLETLRAITAEARAQGLWVAVHAGPADESARSAEAGATTIEHGVRQGNVIDERTLEALRRHGVVYVPTLGREPGAEVNIPALVAGGIAIGVGTDGEDYYEELERLAEAGMPAPEVLLAATRNGARGLLKEGDLGTIEEGKLADVILVAGEPWNDVRDLRSVAAVIQDGRIVVDRR